MINIVFSKMEAYSGNFGISLNKLQAKNSLVPGGRHQGSGNGNKTPSHDDGEVSMKNLSEKSLKIKGAAGSGSGSQSSQVVVTEPLQQTFNEEEKEGFGQVTITDASSPL